MNRRSLMALVASTALAGCNGATQARGEAAITASNGNWGQFRGEPGRCGYSTREYSFGREPTIRATEYESVAVPVLDGDTAIIPSTSSLVGVDLRGLTAKYEIPLEGVPTLPPARCSSVVAVVTEGRVAGYDVESQSRGWSLSAENTHDASTAPAALGDHFVVQDGNRVRLVEHDSGSVVWGREFDARIEGFAADQDLLVVNRNTGDESALVALDPSNGETQWSVTVESSRLHPVVGKFVFALSEHGHLVAIEDGEVRWRVETEARNPESIAVADDVAVVVSESNDRCVGVAIGDESVAWQSNLEFGDAVVVAGDRAFISDANAGVIGLDVTTGQQTQVIQNAKFADSLVPTSQGLLYTQSSDDRVFLIRDG